MYNRFFCYITHHLELSKKNRYHCTHQPHALGNMHTDNLQIDSSVVTIVGSQCESNYEDGKYCVEVHGHGGRESTCCQRAKQIHEILVLELTPCNDGYFENIALNFGS